MNSFKQLKEILSSKDEFYSSLTVHGTSDKNMNMLLTFGKHSK